MEIESTTVGKIDQQKIDENSTELPRFIHIEKNC